MTIKEYVEQHNKMGINEWIEVIKKDGLEHLEDKILAVADSLNKIKVNHKADFVSAIKSSWTKVIKAKDTTQYKIDDIEFLKGMLELQLIDYLPEEDENLIKQFVEEEGEKVINESAGESTDDIPWQAENWLTEPTEEEKEKANEEYIKIEQETQEYLTNKYNEWKKNKYNI